MTKIVAKKVAMVGSGSWATALVKILTDNGHNVIWWIRTQEAASHIKNHGYNPRHLTSVHFNRKFITTTSDVNEAVASSDFIILAVPSSYISDVLKLVDKKYLAGKKVLSAIKGLISNDNLLLNEFLADHYNFPVSNYFTVLGPCHAEEVACEKLSYLTFSGQDNAEIEKIAHLFKTHYINIILNNDILGVQLAAVCKNIYALGAGIANGLGYGDNFLSVYIANCADEMAGFLKRVGAQHIVVGEHISSNKKDVNYAASVYLGDLLVTCYSPHSRNRTFGNMIGKGYSVQSARFEMNMIAEGYNAARSIFNLSKKNNVDTPIAQIIYEILWENVEPKTGFERIEKILL